MPHTATLQRSTRVAGGNLLRARAMRANRHNRVPSPIAAPATGSATKRLLTRPRNTCLSARSARSLACGGKGLAQSAAASRCCSTSGHLAARSSGRTRGSGRDEGCRRQAKEGQSHRGDARMQATALLLLFRNGGGGCSATAACHCCLCSLGWKVKRAHVAGQQAQLQRHPAAPSSARHGRAGARAQPVAGASIGAAAAALPRTAAAGGCCCCWCNAPAAGTAQHSTGGAQHSPHLSLGSLIISCSTASRTAAFSSSGTRLHSLQQRAQRGHTSGGTACRPLLLRACNVRGACDVPTAACRRVRLQAADCTLLLLQRKATPCCCCSGRPRAVAAATAAARTACRASCASCCRLYSWR